MYAILVEKAGHLRKKLDILASANTGLANWSYGHVLIVLRKARLKKHTWYANNLRGICIYGSSEVIERRIFVTTVSCCRMGGGWRGGRLLFE